MYIPVVELLYPIGNIGLQLLVQWDDIGEPIDRVTCIHVIMSNGEQLAFRRAACEEW